MDDSLTYEKYYCQPGTMRIATSVTEIQDELQTNGPMMVGLVVYEDFYSYKSGVYHYTAGEIVGGHAMKLIGWGTDATDGSLYWICQNQWSEAWGEKGFINIKAGEIGIDAMAISCNPDIEKDQ